MARPLRIEYPETVYHVTFRGNERKAVFRDEANRKETGAAVSHQLRRWREAASGSGRWNGIEQGLNRKLGGI